MKNAFPLNSTLLAITLIIAGSFIYYRWGYKQYDIWIRLPALGLPAIGYFILWGNLNDAITKKAPVFAKPGIFLVFVLIMFTNSRIVVSAEENRVNSILTSEKTNTTIATVTKLEIHKGRGALARYAIINYQTKKDDISITIPNDDQKYKVGEQLEIKYALDYPDMAVVTKVVNSQ